MFVQLWHIVEHLFIWVLFTGLTCLGLGKAMKAATDNEYVLHSVLTGLQLYLSHIPF